VTGGRRIAFREEGFHRRLLDWIAGDGAAAASIPLLIDSYARFLNREGFAVRRCNLATETIHPLMANSRHVWFDQATEPSTVNPAIIIERRQYYVEGAMIDELFMNSIAQQNPQYLASPFARVDDDHDLYEPILAPGDVQAFPVFDDLAALGCTAYYAAKLKSFAGLMQKLGIASECPGGLSEPQLAALRSSVQLVTLHLNTLVESDTKRTLARVYLGDDPGSRVCAGMIRVGDVVALEAAIWFSDLRGFTAWSEGLSPERTIERLNAYFEAVSRPIYAAGGEILKYIGDAILAVFPAGPEGAVDGACGAAMQALADVESRLAELNARCEAGGEPGFAHGVGLHVGKVGYGNIGSRDRLDFTVVGEAVNLASRIEGMCKTLDQPALCSAAFAERIEAATRPLGDHALKGISGPVALCAFV
jgi:adenylate cyclase